MRNIIIVLLTIIVKASVIFGLSILLDWRFIDLAFLGGVVIFGVMWWFQMNSVQMNNRENSYLRGMFGFDTPSVTVFHLNLNPVTVGMVLYLLLSGISTFVYYVEYF